MNEDLVDEERRRSGSPLLAVLAFLSTLLLITCFIGEAPAGEGPSASVSAAAPAASGPADETSNATLGCGDAESCYASN